MSAASASLELANRTEELVRLGPFVREFGSAQRLPTDVTEAVQLALEEIVTNVIRHGFDDAGPHTIRIRLERDGNGVSAVVEDDGRAFDPLSRPVPAIAEPIERRSVGGLGLWLVRNNMDQLHYRRERDKNILVMHKLVPPA
jgi:anti-sigma regulatory factor (Ser/Thr protein kinase)